MGCPLSPAARDASDRMRSPAGNCVANARSLGDNGFVSQCADGSAGLRAPLEYGVALESDPAGPSPVVAAANKDASR